MALLSRKFILPASCFLSAVAGFSIGGIFNSTPDTTPTASEPASSKPSISSEKDFSHTENTESNHSPSSVENGANTEKTITEITSGQSLESWLKKVMAQDDEIYRMRQFMRLMESLDNTEDIKIALKVLSENSDARRGPFGSRFTEFAMLMSKFAQLDPYAAMAYAAGRDGGEQFMATSTALRAWTRTAPDAALAWAQTEGAKMEIDFGRGRSDNEAAPKVNIPLLSMLSQLAKTDLDKAITTASTTEFGEMGRRVVDGILGELVSQRGMEAARTVANSLPEGSFKEQLIQQLAPRLAKENPVEAAGWASSFPSGKIKTQALGEVIETWARADAPAAGAYLAQQVPSPDLDSAISAYSREITSKEPTKAWEWANTITDTERKIRTLSFVARDWSRTDEQAANAAIASSTYAEDVKNAIDRQRNNRNFKLQR